MKKTGFTLIETLFALAILTLIAILLLPSLNNLIKSSNALKEDSKVIFALEEAIEVEKLNTVNGELSYDESIRNINGYDISINREQYSKNLDKISASFGRYHLEVIEDNYEKKRLYSR
ncbi:MULTISPECIES: competence type IV pilus minor pilin ComGE [Anaerococcus]|uniref:Prepilin-type cleavage/methylation domain-containing protein n=1 Tax=Anaerococcus octavius TaxID=54007 RepID=A0A2I1M6R2_9FIRM|nr:MULTISPECIES: competence type IV pilus minor pilin ComGE [Anaerococcus]MBS6106135.1 prepilin-type N-terminal cleavage/methylation domain-containing protein [Anaerococcus sp.]MDU2599720.1 competence type IV pilus minor pilin ComGE [Anaerococcus sp.]PKZ15808.1 prepilin-type cleavage/methylation domain-containing protein [Anaerococcus octavius]SUU92639.1 Tfp pilus assembly protein FimT [Anaerococcus octavius]